MEAHLLAIAQHDHVISKTNKIPTNTVTLKKKKLRLNVKVYYDLCQFQGCSGNGTLLLQKKRRKAD